MMKNTWTHTVYSIFYEFEGVKAVLSFNPIFHENPNEIYIPVYQAQSLQTPTSHFLSVV